MVLVAGIGVPGTPAERPRRAHLARAHAGAAATDPAGELACGRVGGLDRVAVDLVDVDRAPHAVVGHPVGPADIPGVASANARHADAVLRRCCGAGRAITRALRPAAPPRQWRARGMSTRGTRGSTRRRRPRAPGRARTGAAAPAGEGRAGPGSGATSQPGCRPGTAA